MNVEIKGVCKGKTKKGYYGCFALATIIINGCVFESKGYINTVDKPKEGKTLVLPDNSHVQTKPQMELAKDGKSYVQRVDKKTGELLFFSKWVLS